MTGISECHSLLSHRMAFKHRRSQRATATQQATFPSLATKLQPYWYGYVPSPCYPQSFCFCFA